MEQRKAEAGIDGCINESGRRIRVKSARSIVQGFAMTITVMMHTCARTCLHGVICGKCALQAPLKEIEERAVHVLEKQDPVADGGHGDSHLDVPAVRNRSSAEGLMRE